MSELISCVCFILALQGLSTLKHARNGNWIAVAGMAIAIIAALSGPAIHRYGGILSTILIGGGVGFIVAQKIPMMSLPQLVAAFHSLIGCAAVLVAGSSLHSPQSFHIGTLGNIKTVSLIEMGIGSIIGAITFSGSLVAFGKLQGLLSGKPILLQNRHFINLSIVGFLGVLLIFFINTQSILLFWFISLVAFILGFLLIIPIGGADMPVVVSMLNSYSGWAASGIGFTINNSLLIATGALVGSSGAILSYIMCKGMNRSIISVLMGGFGQTQSSSNTPAKISNSEQLSEDNAIRNATPVEAAHFLMQAKSVIIVPGYGMAVSQAQHALRKIGDFLKAKDILVRYAIHPVAGRMPGHMNVLLAEANIPYSHVKELEEINDDFKNTDVVVVIGANDIVNPSAKYDETSPIYGMPILDVESAKKILFIKRSLGSGYAGVDNPLFYQSNVYMVFGDGRAVCEEVFDAFSK
jgi:NAD(P) transhydrogenase subunit beta